MAEPWIRPAFRPTAPPTIISVLAEHTDEAQFNLLTGGDFDR
jgi:hypothetical protein